MHQGPGSSGGSGPSSSTSGGMGHSSGSSGSSGNFGSAGGHTPSFAPSAPPPGHQGHWGQQPVPTGEGYPPYQPYPPYLPYPPSPYPPMSPYPPYPGYAPYPPAGYYPYPGYPPYPPMLPQPNAPKKSYRGLWITLSAVAGVIVILCISCSALFGLAINNIASQVTTTPVALDPVIAAANFCAYETNQDYASAYGLFSTNLQGQVSQQQFTSDNQARDTQHGMVVGCAAASQQNNTADSSPTSPDTLTLNIWIGPASGTGKPTNYSGNITMIQNSAGTWQIDAIDSTLPLT